jgi:Domain of unknown function (DUF1824)
MDLSLQSAHNMLKAFDCLTPKAIAPKAIASETERLQVQQALLQVAQSSDYQILGICAPTAEQAYQALKSYAGALGYETVGIATVEAAEPSAKAVYLKFNPKLGSCYLAPYEGTHCGVLVACQSADASGLNEMYGHLPADLFE